MTEFQKQIPVRTSSQLGLSKVVLSVFLLSLGGSGTTCGHNTWHTITIWECGKRAHTQSVSDLVFHTWREISGLSLTMSDFNLVLVCCTMAISQLLSLLPPQPPGSLVNYCLTWPVAGDGRPPLLHFCQTFLLVKGKLSSLLASSVHACGCGSCWVPLCDSRSVRSWLYSIKRLKITYDVILCYSI